MPHLAPMFWFLAPWMIITFIFIIFSQIYFYLNVPQTSLTPKNLKKTLLKWKIFYDSPI